MGLRGRRFGRWPFPGSHDRQPGREVALWKCSIPITIPQSLGLYPISSEEKAEGFSPNQPRCLEVPLNAGRERRFHLFSESHRVNVILQAAAHFLGRPLSIMHTVPFQQLNSLSELSRSLTRFLLRCV